MEENTKSLIKQQAWESAPKMHISCFVICNFLYFLPVSEQVWNYIPFLRRRDLILLWILFEKVWGYCRKRQSILDGCTDSPWSD